MNRLPAPRNRRGMLVGCAIAAAAAVPAVGQSAPADYIFWTTSTGGTSIGRVANQAGATPDASFITGVTGPTGITLLGSHLYWTQSGGIGRANTDGSDPRPGFLPLSNLTDAIFAGRPCSAAATCDSYVYYGQGTPGTPNTYSVVRRNLDGTSPTTILSTANLGRQKPYALGYLSGTANAMGNIFVSYVDEAYMFTPGVGYRQSGAWDFPRWTGTSMVSPGMAVGWGPSGPAGVAYVYIANGTAITRLTAGCSGGGSGCFNNAFVTGAASLSTAGVGGVAVDDTYIYWINRKIGADSIGRVSLDGTTGKNPDFVTLPGEAFGIAVGSSSGGGDNGGGSNTGGDSGGGSGGGAGSSGPATPTSPTSQPSNTFTVRKGMPRGLAVTTRVTVPGEGQISQRGTRPTRRALASAVRRVGACTGSRTARAAGTVTVTCRLTAATQTARRSGAVTMRLATMFTPAGGAARTITQVVVLPKINARPSAVTG